MGSSTWQATSRNGRNHSWTRDCHTRAGATGPKPLPIPWRTSWRWTIRGPRAPPSTSPVSVVLRGEAEARWSERGPDGSHRAQHVRHLLGEVELSNDEQRTAHADRIGAHQAVTEEEGEPMVARAIVPRHGWRAHQQ